MSPSNPIANSKKLKAFKLLSQGRVREAVQILEQIVNKYPKDVEALATLGSIYGQSDQLESAVLYLERVVEINPNDLDTLNNLGVANMMLGNTDKARGFMERSLRLNPNDADLHFNLASIFQECNKIDTAIEHFRKALQLKPNSVDAIINLGVALKETGQIRESLALFKKAISLEPDSAEANLNLGIVLVLAGKPNEAVQYYEQAAASAPGDDEKIRALAHILFAINYDLGCSQEEVYQAHKNWSEQLEQHVTRHERVQNNHNKNIRIGYVSPDFRTHSVAFFLEPVLSHHDKNEFEIYCYANVLEPDETTERFKAYVTKWRETYQMTDGALHQQILDDKIDILIDLAGHTLNNRLSIFARKPAPVQMTYLGYPNTTGLSSIDYRITDEITDPQGQEKYYTESLARLPGCFLCYQPSTDAPAVIETSLKKNDHVTFGSFNNLTKITDNVIRVYSEILTATANSKLVLKNRSFHDTDIRKRYINMFSYNNIDASRLVFLATTPTTVEHLELYKTIDIALDTFPYNGTTTTCEALHMGTPVIALLGDRHASRVSASLLTAIGHEELIANSEQDYVRLAVELANDVAKIKRYNKNLRNDMLSSPLCDAPAFTRKLETAYSHAWGKYCKENN